MLKLNKAYRYTRTEWQHVSTILIPYVRLYGGQKGWDKADNATKDLKNSISEFTLVQQDCRCAYCEALITGGAQLIILFQNNYILNSAMSQRIFSHLVRCVICILRMLKIL